MDWFGHKPRNASNPYKLEDKKTDSPLELPERTKPANILLLALCSLFADLWPAELEEDEFLWFQATKFVELFLKWKLETNTVQNQFIYIQISFFFLSSMSREFYILAPKTVPKTEYMPNKKTQRSSERSLWYHDILQI